MHEDRAIARRLLDGDETAFRAVFDDYFPASADSTGRADVLRSWDQTDALNAGFHSDTAKWTLSCAIHRGPRVEYCTGQPSR